MRQTILGALVMAWHRWWNSHDRVEWTHQRMQNCYDVY